MAYSKTDWENNISPYINATNLDKMETGIYDANYMATGRCATFVVAANDSSALSKQQADYVCDGTDDQVPIQAAIDALPVGGGKVLLIDGNFVKSNISAITLPSYTTLELQGTITFKNSVGDGAIIFQNSDTSGGNTRINIIGGILDGNKDNQTGVQTAISLTNVEYSKIETGMQNFCGHNVVQTNNQNNIVTNTLYPDVEVIDENRQQIVSPPSFMFCNYDDVNFGANSAFDTSQFFTYPKSIKMTSTDYFTSPAIIYHLFAPNADLTGCQFHLMSRHSDTNHKMHRIILHAPDYANRITFDQSTTQNILDRWYMRSFSLADSYDTGAPDITNVSRIDVYSYSNSGVTAISYIDEMFVSKITETPSGVVTFVFDDGLRTVYTAGAEIFAKYGFAASLAIIPTPIIAGNADYLTIDHCKILQQSGWDMVNHGYAHKPLDGLSAAECEDDIGRGKSWLINNGFKQASDFYIYPLTVIDENGLDAAKKYHFMARVGDSKVNTLPAMDKHTLHTYKFETLSVADCQTLIDDTITNKGWLILYGHGVGAAEDVDPTDLATILAYCKTNNVPVTTMSDVWNNYRKW